MRHPTDPSGAIDEKGGRTPAKSPTPKDERSATSIVTGSPAPGKPRDATLADLRRTLPVASSIEPLLKLDDLCRVLNCERRTVERLRSAGKLPRPDLLIGTGSRQSPRWKAATVRAWIEQGGAR